MSFEKTYEKEHSGWSKKRKSIYLTESFKFLLVPLKVFMSAKNPNPFQ